MISIDASNKGIGAVFLQEQPDGSLRPCSYYAKTVNKAQRKYPVYDQELLAIAADLNEHRRNRMEIYPLQKGMLSTSFPRWGVTVMWEGWGFCLWGLEEASVSTMTYIK